MNIKNPVESLHQNIDQFFEKTFAKYPEKIKCRINCTQCCHVDLSISQVEVVRIQDWFGSLNEEQKNKFKLQWQIKQPLGKSYTSNETKPCAFLYDGGCTIYEARPTICRSHGLALMRSENETTKSIDACELNFQSELPPVEDCLDLDRLNSLLAVANKVMKFDDKRTRLKKLKELLLNQ